MPTFLDELLASHTLFFSRSTPSNKVMRSQFSGIDMNIIRDYRDRWSGNISSVHISDFPIYGSRLQHIHQRMTDWRPLHVLDLRHQPYRDPLSYYAFCFAIFFGGLGIGSLVFTIYGAVKDVN